MSSRRRIAPAIVMIVGVAGALVFAALFPAYATGEWSEPQGSWEASRTQLLADTADPASGAGAALGSPLDPESVVLLEELADGGYLFAARTTAGFLAAGVARPEGPTICASADRSPNAEIACEVWRSDDERGYGIWVQRSDTAPSGFRYELEYGERAP
ncbi:hypothetical protein [Leucobacter luti]|uniref:Uncharacterized protein n=1 Tax=Leucobacter luti TaxID=340320 RepID=A0A4Q7U0K9_9MICO|nr:hypothetical protein [Leucobacter luti]MBL3699394.1 hypothetical protein [Leucobacter luti]RZT66904.1 hypothetical protein EV139_1031 [Leucobacter luti]